jgi:hypothetical protein
MHTYYQDIESCRKVIPFYIDRPTWEAMSSKGKVSKCIVISCQAIRTGDATSSMIMNDGEVDTISKWPAGSKIQLNEHYPPIILYAPDQSVVVDLCSGKEDNLYSMVDVSGMGYCIPMNLLVLGKNILRVQLSLPLKHQDAPRSFYIAMKCMEISKPEYFLEQKLALRSILKNKRLKKEKNSLDADVDIEITKADMDPSSGSCPISLRPISIPTKSIHCAHGSCFDFVPFLLLSQNYAQWKCPICDADASWGNIYIINDGT